MGCHALLQGISPMQESTPRLLSFLRWQAGSLPLGSSGKPLENSVRLVVEPVATASVSHVSEAPNWGASLPLPHQAFTKPCLPPLWSFHAPSPLSQIGFSSSTRPLASFPTDAHLVRAASAGTPTLDMHLSSESLRCFCEARGRV